MDYKEYDMEEAIERAEQAYINNLEIRLTEIDNGDEDDEDGYDAWVDNKLSHGEDL